MTKKKLRKKLELAEKNVTFWKGQSDAQTKQIQAVKAALGVRDPSFSTSSTWFGQSLAMDQTTGTTATKIHAVEDAG